MANQLHAVGPVKRAPDGSFWFVRLSDGRYVVVLSKRDDQAMSLALSHGVTAAIWQDRGNAEPIQLQQISPMPNSGIEIQDGQHWFITL